MITIKLYHLKPQSPLRETLRRQNILLLLSTLQAISILNFSRNQMLLAISQKTAFFLTKAGVTGDKSSNREPSSRNYLAPVE